MPNPRQCNAGEISAAPLRFKAGWQQALNIVWLLQFVRLSCLQGQKLWLWQVQPKLYEQRYGSIFIAASPTSLYVAALVSV